MLNGLQYGYGVNRRPRGRECARLGDSVTGGASPCARGVWGRGEGCCLLVGQVVTEQLHVLPILHHPPPEAPLLTQVGVDGFSLSVSTSSGKPPSLPAIKLPPSPRARPWTSDVAPMDLDAEGIIRPPAVEGGEAREQAFLDLLFARSYAVPPLLAALADADLPSRGRADIATVLWKIYLRDSDSGALRCNPTP